MKPIVLTTALSVLLAFNASAEGYKVEYKDINTQWGTKTRIFVTALFDFSTIFGIEVNRGNCEVAWPEMAKVTVNKNKYSQSDDLLNNLSNPDYKAPSSDSKANGVVWHRYPEVDLKYGDSTGYVTTTRCRVLEIKIFSSEGEFRYTTD
ncbi:hypothetical protein KZY93_003238 [Vibrio vulnificus]|uniref:hypothetical protein n=1 Tax=Vibrio vulnificus TaxID=672 RepID=UPI0002E8D235|nr:hypothetical protein [Vibrio vulnificus]EHH2478736.1 hypothetical protein [Vibrio vulnificus]EHU9519829.1 hypothetical protein [Vibrio vulnificus]EME0829226.1 hypothetical protein [Vibrio vulnificus]HAS6936903.1 hypothetical protein [Vibrio vulnificus]